MPASSSEYSACPTWLLEPVATKQRSALEQCVSGAGSQAVRLGCCAPLPPSHLAGLTSAMTLNTLYRAVTVITVQDRDLVLGDHEVE